jgi:hypothetical protein
MARALLLVIAGLFLTTSSCAAADPREVGAPYAETRAALIDDGYRPQAVVRTPENSTACTHPDGDWCSRWPELEDCAGTGVGYCNFVFAAPDGRRWTVTTAGETDPALVAFRPES